MSEGTKRRGPKKGATYAKLVEKVCMNTVDCPRAGRPFSGTAKAKYCGDICSQRALRRRKETAA